MLLIRTIGMISLIALSTKASSMDLQTRTHPMCGIQSYNTHSNDSRCPVAQYLAKSTAACAPIYITKMDYKVCGFDPVRKQRRCERISGSHGQLANQPDPELGCPSGYKEILSPVPASCANAVFGIKDYEFCRDSSHGVESYQTCAMEEFGVAIYKTCSFYKTPEELAAYINATNESVETYRMILPAREGELLSRVNSDSAFACLIRRYEVEPMYDTIVEDLRQKFLLVFGYEERDTVVDCNAEAANPTEIKFILAGIDCDAVPKDDIASIAKPDSVSDQLFARFKQNCTMKKSYDGLLDWFETKLSEVSSLKLDLAAQADPSAANKLEELRSKLEKK